MNHTHKYIEYARIHATTCTLTRCVYDLSYQCLASLASGLYARRQHRQIYNVLLAVRVQHHRMHALAHLHTSNAMLSNKSKTQFSYSYHHSRLVYVHAITVFI